MHLIPSESALIFNISESWDTCVISDQVGAVCQPHGASERFPWPLPEKEADWDGDQQPNAQHGAGEDYRLGTAGLAPPQPLPGNTQFLWCHHWWGDAEAQTVNRSQCRSRIYICALLLSGPRLFLSCPMDVEGSRVWFTDLWNYSIIPYMLEAVREGLQVT